MKLHRQLLTALFLAAPLALAAESLPSYVKPLIGDPQYRDAPGFEQYVGYMPWNQYSPLNDYCPKDNGQACAVGCVALSMAQVMSAHKWPAQAEGTASYLWKGQTLTTTFDKPYNWSLLKYRYAGGYTTEEGDFIATLLRDIGYSIHMNYGAGYEGSGTAEEYAAKALVNHFKYDRSIGYLCRDYCTNEYWENLLRSEIAAGRPVMYGGGSDVGAHEFTCDGYDAQGRFFFHMGSTGQDGYYATLSPDLQYTTSQTAIFRIMPNNDAAATGKATMLAGSNKDFLWKQGTSITSNVRFFTPVESFSAKIAVAVENTATGDVSYCNEQSLTTSTENNNGTVVTSFSVSGTYPDGVYNVYPVYRAEADSHWQKVLFGEYCQDRVTLRVSGGAMTFSNEDLKENIDEGKVKVNGIVYYLDNSNSTASVTYQNSGYNTYSGDVTVPETFSYNGQTYTVTSIGEKAFYDCSDATSVSLPATVMSIAYGAFYKCKASTITFAEGSVLRTIANYGFAYAGMTSLALPEGLTSVGGEAFVGCYELTNVVLPTTLTSLPKSAFSACSYIRNFTCKTATPPSCSLSNDPFENVMDAFFPMMTLYVPAGSAEAYRAHEVWSRFGNIVEGEGPGVGPVTPDPGTGGDSDAPIPGTYSIQLYGTDLYFSTAQVNGYSMTTCSLSDKPEYFYIEAVSGGYTITSAKNDRKIGYSAKAGTGLSLMDVCDVASTWTIEDLNGSPSRILRKNSTMGLGADDDEWASAVYTNQQSTMSINCYWTLTKVEGDPVLANAIELSETEAKLKVGETLTISATISPANATKKTVAWESLNPDIATVSASGVITAVGAGEAIILATTTDGTNKRAFITVTVTQDETPVDPDPETPVDPDTPRAKYFIQLQGTDLYFSTNLVADHDFKTYSLSSTPEPFYIEQTDGGYTITSAVSGKHVGFSTTTAGSLTTWDFCDAASTWVIDNVEGEPTRILKKGYDVGFGADTAADGEGVYTDKKSAGCDYFTWLITSVEEVETVYTFSPSSDTTRYFSTDEFIENGRPTYCLSSTPEYFRVKKVEGGYTIQSTKTGQYAGISTNKHWDFADEPTVWSVSALTGTVTILRATGETTKGFGWDTDGGTYTDKVGMQWTITPHVYTGDSAGLLVNMIRRANAGKCTKEDVETVVNNILLRK